MIIHNSISFIRENWIDILLATIVMVVIFIWTTLHQGQKESLENIEERLCENYVGKTDELEKIVSNFSRSTCNVCRCCAWVKDKEGREKCVASHGKDPVYDGDTHKEIFYMGKKLK
jgi:hypothetical protein